MFFFATGTLVHPEKVASLLAEEKRVLAALRAEGVVREAYLRAGSPPTLVSFLEAASLEEVRAKMARLPMVSSGVMTFEYVEVTPL